MANGKIYVNQSSLRMTLDTGVVLTGATTLQIKHIKTDLSTGFWVASIDPSDANKLFYDFINTELDQSGNWIFWAFVIFSDGRNAPGEPVKVKVHEQGT